MSPTEEGLLLIRGTPKKHVYAKTIHIPCNLFLPFQIHFMQSFFCLLTSCVRKCHLCDTEKVIWSWRQCPTLIFAIASLEACSFQYYSMLLILVRSWVHFTNKNCSFSHTEGLKRHKQETLLVRLSASNRECREQRRNFQSKTLRHEDHVDVWEVSRFNLPLSSFTPLLPYWKAAFNNPRVIICGDDIIIRIFWIHVYEF